MKISAASRRGVEGKINASASGKASTSETKRGEKSTSGGGGKNGQQESHCEIRVADVGIIELFFYEVTHVCHCDVTPLRDKRRRGTVRLKERENFRRAIESAGFRIGKEEGEKK